jgi:short-subunit dehydrogenase
MEAQQNSSVSTTRPLALVTGASSGIGLELAKRFAEHGFDLLVTGKSRHILEVARTLQELGGKVESFQADLAKFEGVEALYAWVRTKGPLEAVALNAGVGVGGDFLRDTKLVDDLNLIQLNVVSVVHLSKHIGRDMVEQGRGKILVTASVGANMPTPYLAVYGASKAFVHSFAGALRSELQGSGVSVTSLMPGPTDTRWFARARVANTKLGKLKRDDPATVASEGFAALMAGKDHVVAGSLVNSVQAGLARLIPQRVVTAIARPFHKPMTTPPVR